jgi:hypothetical protein
MFLGTAFPEHMNIASAYRFRGVQERSGAAVLRLAATETLVEPF